MFTNALATFKRHTKAKDVNGYPTQGIVTLFTDMPCLLGSNAYARTPYAQGMDARQSGNESMSIYKNLPQPIFIDDVVTVLHGGLRQDFVVTSARPTQSIVVSHWKIDLKVLGLPISAAKVGAFLGDINGNPYIVTTSLPVTQGDWYSIVLDPSSDGVQTVYNYNIGYDLKQVFVNGILQVAGTYTASSGVLTLSEAPHEGAEVKAFYFQ